MIKPVEKPAWCPSSEWNNVLTTSRNEEGELRCCRCGVALTNENCWPDHIKPRSEGGLDVSSNLQLMCEACNRKKYTKPDDIWGRRHYFDETIHLHRLRCSQLDYVYNPIAIQYAELFSKDASRFSGKLFLLAQIVGAGKTLGAFSVPFALNAAKNAIGPNRARVATTAIIVKDRALREQVARELKNEPIEYQIVDLPPKVLEIKQAAQLLDYANIRKHDIVVFCLQSIWGDRRKFTITPEQLPIVLAQFEAIIFDECHFANAVQVNNICAQAVNSTCFGCTATGIDQAGDLLNTAILVSTYDYRSANRHDNSMAGLGETSYSGTVVENLLTAIGRKNTAERKAVRDELSTLYSDIVHVVRNDRLKTATARDWIVADDPASGAALRNSLESTFAVAHGVVEHLAYLDQESSRGSTDLAPHRRNFKRGRVEVGYDFPAHAKIRVETVEECEYLVEFLNDKFRNGGYSRAKGWYATAAHGGGKDHLPKPLTKDHPWLRAVDTGKLDTQCSRILVVADLAKEGVNNKFCKVIGMACRCDSLQSLVQIAGRAIRSPHKVEDGVYYVPPRALDEMTFFVHEAYHEPWRLPWAFQFMEYMERNMGAMETIEAFIERSGFSVQLLKPDDDVVGRLGYIERLMAADQLAYQFYETGTVTERDVEKCLTRLLGANVNANLRQVFQDWAVTVLQACENNTGAQNDIQQQLQLFGRLGNERVATEATFDRQQASRPMKESRWNAIFDNQRLNIPEDKFDDAVDMFWEHIMRHREGGHVDAKRTLREVADDMIRDLIRVVEVRSNAKKRVIMETVAGFVDQAFEMALGVDDFETTTHNTNANLSNYFGNDWRCRRRIYGYVAHELARAGYLEGIMLCAPIQKGGD